jgi:hypothetical protein
MVKDEAETAACSAWLEKLAARQRDGLPSAARQQLAFAFRAGWKAHAAQAGNGAEAHAGQVTEEPPAQPDQEPDVRRCPHGQKMTPANSVMKRDTESGTLVARCRERRRKGRAAARQRGYEQDPQFKQRERERLRSYGATSG